MTSRENQSRKAIRYKKPTAQTDVGNIYAPNLIGPLDGKAAQQVRISRVSRRARMRKVWPRELCFQSHFRTVATDRMPSDHHSFGSQEVNQLARSQARALCVPLIQAVLDQDLLFFGWPRHRIQAAARNRQEFRLPNKWYGVLLFAGHQCQSLIRGQVRDQIFFDPGQLRGEATDLFIKLCDFLFLGFLSLSLRVFALEDNGQFGNGFLLPFGHQVRVKLMLGCQLGDGLGFAQGFQDNLSLENCRILFSGSTGSEAGLSVCFYVRFVLIFGISFPLLFVLFFRLFMGGGIHLSLAHFAV